MVQLRVLHGTTAGEALAVNRFPCTLGRATTDDLQFPDVGVWDQHLQLDRQVPQGFLLRRLGAGRASVNGTEFDEVFLHNGDTVDFGGVKLRFWLADVRQSNNDTRELFAWSCLLLLVLLEAGLLIWLLR